MISARNQLESSVIKLGGGYLAMHKKIVKLAFLHAIRHMKNTVVGGVIYTLNDIICKPATNHGQGEVIID